MDLNNYIDTIVFYVASAVAALGGTSLGIGAICGWIKKSSFKQSKNLLQQKAIMTRMQPNFKARRISLRMLVTK